MSENGFISSGAIFDAMVDFFQEDEWDFDQIGRKPELVMNYGGDNGEWRCLAQARDEESQFVFYSVLEEGVPAEKLAPAAEYLMRATYGLVMGAFELGFDEEGEVRFRTGIDVSGGELTKDMIKNIVYFNLYITDRYLPGLKRVLDDGIPPAEAVAEVEAQDE
jgi:hypothetical protein